MASAQDPRGGERDDRFVPYLLLFFQSDCPFEANQMVVKLVPEPPYRTEDKHTMQLTRAET
jgi:hypothetical protein